MPVRIRLTRMGAKKRPYYRVVASDSRSPRDGRFLDILGFYNPFIKEGRKFKIDEGKLSYWLSVGSQPTDRVSKFIKQMSE